MNRQGMLDTSTDNETQNKHTTMTPDKIKLLCNGIASVADATGALFDDVLEDMVTIGILTLDQEEAVMDYMSSH